MDLPPELDPNPAPAPVALISPDQAAPATPIVLPVTPAVESPGAGPDLSIRARLMTILGPASILLMIASGISFAYVRFPDLNLAFATLLFALGALCMGGLFYLQRRPDVLTRSISIRRAGFAFVILGVLMMAFETLLSARRFELSVLFSIPYIVQDILFWGGISLVLYGFTGADLWMAAKRVVAWFQTRQGLLLLLIVLVAFGLRAWNLETPLSNDDGPHLPSAWPFLADNLRVGLIAPNAWHSSSLWGQFQALSLQLFGYNLTSLRLVSAAVGTLALLAVFMLGEALIDRRFGLLCAAMLATLPPQLHFSRQIMLHIADSTAGAFAMAFLARALRDGRRLDWALSGVFLGLSMYFFEAGRLFFPIFFIGSFVLFSLLRPRQFAARARGWLLLAGCALLLIVPLVYTFTALNVPWTNRLNESGIVGSFWGNLLATGFTPANIQVALNQIKQPFLFYVSLHENTLYYGGTDPLVQPVLVPLFLLGIVVLLLQQFRKPGLLVPLWLAGVATANILLRDPIQTPRFVIVYPAIAVALAAGLYALPTLLSDRLRRSPLVQAAGVALVILIAGYQGVYYLGWHLPALRQQILASFSNPDALDAAQRIAKLPPGTQVYYVTATPIDTDVPSGYVGIYRFGAPQPPVDIKSASLNGITADFVAGLRRDRDFAFLIPRGKEQAVLDVLQTRFTFDPPRYTPRTDIPTDKQFVLYFAPLDKQTGTAASR